MMSEETFKTWKAMPETKEFFKFLELEERSHRFMVTLAPNLMDNNEDIIKKYLMHIHKADVYNVISNTTYEDIEHVTERAKEEEDDYQTAWASSASSSRRD